MCKFTAGLSSEIGQQLLHLTIHQSSSSSTPNWETKIEEGRVKSEEVHRELTPSITTKTASFFLNNLVDVQI